MAKKFVVWFKDVDKDDGAIVGGKGANLGEMTKAGFPVPTGFIVTAQAYTYFLSENKLPDKIEQLLHRIDVSDSKALDQASVAIQKLIVHAKIPKEVATAIIEAYFQLDEGLMSHAWVAVRSSATAEDLPGASFAGQQSTFLNVHGEADVLEKAKEAWASLFTPRAIFYRATNHFDHFKIAIALPVQKMVASETSGIMFTLDPVTNDKGKIVIEAILGLGEMIVQGAVTPDHYEVDKASGVITKKAVHEQEKMMFKDGSTNVIRSVDKKLAHKQKITDGQILAIAKLGKQLEHHYYFPQDIEWAIEKDKVYIVQTRPVTTISKNGRQNETSEGTQKKEVLLKGDPASPGMASGPVKILKSAKEIHRIIPGDVLVAEMTNPDYVPAMKKAVAIVTERGGRTSHAAIVSRELGIPAVVGAAGALKTLKEGLVITVNGAAGEVYEGAVKIMPNAKLQIPNRNAVNLKTATKVYVNLAQPERAAVIAKANVDGVGLLRAEFMMATIGTHPRKFIEDKKQQVFIDKLAEGLETICESFYPRPVVYRASDFRTNEFRNLKGGQRYEPKEENPMLGFRGAARYVADAKVFELELSAMKLVRNKKNLKNLSLMIPFVRTPQELLDVKRLVAANGLSRSGTFHLWMMVEIPTNVIQIDAFLDVGIDGVSIGSNDLTMLTLGIDRDNSEVAPKFNEMDPSLLWSFERVVRACAKRGVTASICGQAPSDYPELVDKLVSWGITSISVNPDVVDHVRETVAEAEKKLVRRR